MASIGTRGVSDRANPFTPGPGLDPPYLAGREEELRIFDTTLQNTARGKASNIMLYGLRGVGKTVLLRKFAGICRDKKFLPIARYQYSHNDSNPNEFTAGIKHIMRGAIESSSKAGAAKGRLRSAGQYLKPASAGASGLAYYEPSYAHGRQEPLGDHLADYLAKNWKVIDSLGYDGAILLLDEFHTVNDVKKGGWYALTDFLGAVNEVQKDGCRYSLVLSGLPTILKNVKVARSYAERMFGLVEVSSLSQHGGRQAIIQPLAGLEITFSPALVDAVVKDSGGYPYFIQFFACGILRRTNAKKIGMKEYKSIRDDLIRSLYHEFFEQCMVDLSPSEKSTLHHMSKMPESGMRFSSIMNSTGRSKGVVSSSLKRLEKKGIVYKYNHGLYAFALPTLKSYLSYAAGEAGYR